MPSTHNIVPSQFPSPDEGTIAYVLCVPNIPQWRQVVLGHLLTMTYGYFWDKNSGDFDRARDVMKEIVYPLLDSSSDCFCDLVTDCILNNSSTTNAIRKIVNSSTVGTPSDNLTDGIIGSSCSEDVVWGATNQFVDDLNLYIEDSFQVIETATNFVEVIADWLGGFPVVGGLLSLIPDILTYIQDTLAEEYESAYNQTLANEIKCELFCLLLQDCEIDVTTIFNYFIEQAGLSVIPDNLEDVIDFVLNGVFTGDTWVYAMSALAVGFLALGDPVIGSLPFITFPSTNALRISFALGANNPSNDWQILCDPCQFEWEFSRFGGSGNADSLIIAASGRGGAPVCTGSYDALNDRAVACYSGSSSSIAPYASIVVVRIDFGVDCRLESVDLRGLVSSYRSNEDNGLLFLRLFDSSGNMLVNSFSSGVVSKQVWTGDQPDVRSIELYARSYSSTPTLVDAFIDGVTVKGRGVKPTFLP